jgi:hypothetical protein
VSWFTALGLLVWARPLLADEPIRFTYLASAGCPDESSFVAQVLGRTTRWGAAEPEESVTRW